MKNDRVPFYALGSEHNPEWKSQALEDGALLDMQFQVSGGISAFLLRLRKSIEGIAASPDRILKTYAVPVGSSAILFNRVRARER